MQNSRSLASARVQRNLVRGLLWCALAAGTATIASATEIGASVYPAGVETILPGMTPPPGGTMFLEFNNFYMANGLANSKGQSEVPGFHLRVAAIALKIVHNWGVKILGGTLVSSAAVPLLYESLTVPGAAGSKTGFGNPDLQLAGLAYAKGCLHWWYGFDLMTPGFAYGKNDLLNVGQHNFAYAPQAAFSFIPHHGRIEVSSKFQYIINGRDSATNYQSGREFLWEHDVMIRITRNLTVGGNGFWYKQVSNDFQNGLIVGDGNRGRDFAYGPEIKYHIGRSALVLKYEKDMFVQNRPIGNAFWLQLGIPLWREHE